jgi:hypothetical protein
MTFGTWSVRSLYRSGSLNKLDLVRVQEVGWDKGGTERTEDYTFYGVGNEDHQLGTGFFCA